MLVPANPDSLTYRLHALINAVQVRRNRDRADLVFERALAAIDRDAFIERFRRYWTPFPTMGPPKYLELNAWMRQAAHRYLLTGLPSLPPARRILDLGAGAGYFPFICLQHGHQPLALDVDDEPLYRELIEFLGVPRVVHRIEPLRKLPRFDRRFDLITSFKICFNVRADGSPWDVDEWSFLLQDLRGQLADGGRIVLGFNLHPGTRALYPRRVASLLQRAPGFTGRLFYEYALLRRK